jgi:alpha-D-xyloside xylohydrolase
MRPLGKLGVTILLFAALAANAQTTRFKFGSPEHTFPLQKSHDFGVAPANFVAKIGETSAVLGAPLAKNESLFGFGERFDAWNLRGREMESWARDMAQGGPNSSYFAVPFFISSEGYGLFVNCSGRVKFDFGATKSDELRIEIPESGAEIFVFRGTPREILRAYTALVGRPKLPPDWVFQPWFSRNSYMTAAEIDEVLDKADELGLRAGAVVLEAWAQSLQNFRFEEARFPNPREWIAKMHARGARVVCWETPSIWDSASTYAEAKEKGFLVLNRFGHEQIFDWLENSRKIDFRKPDARVWWQKLHEPLIEMGVDGFKTDGGERHPDDFFHNLHPYYYVRSVHDAFAAQGKPAVTFARSASAPSAGLSIFWAGDQHAEWSSLPKIVRAGLSAAMSGFPFWGHDIGGYAGTPTKKLYIRWMQLGAFSPVMQFHGITPREPWQFDEETVRIARWCFGVRAALQPHIIMAARQASEEGVPIWRPIFYEFPEDEAARSIEDQFFFGPELLVAPILDESDERNVYFPSGKWVDLWSGERHEGPKTARICAPLSGIPVFVREESYEKWMRELPKRR